MTLKPIVLIKQSNCWNSYHQIKSFPKPFANYKWLKRNPLKVLSMNLNSITESPNSKNSTVCSRKRSPNKPTKMKCLPTRNNKSFQYMKSAWERLKVFLCKLSDNSKAVVWIAATSPNVPVTLNKWRFLTSPILKFNWNNFIQWFKISNSKTLMIPRTYLTNKV